MVRIILPKIKVDGANIYYETAGRGEPLALVGGSLFGRFNWDMVRKNFVQNFRVVSYDMSGYGQSDRPIRDYSISFWADELASLLRALKINRAHVAGTSMGGMIALAFAAKYPSMTNGVVADCAFAKPDRRRKMLMESWRKLAQTIGLGDIFSDLVMTQAVGDAFLDSKAASQAIEGTRTIVRLNSVETVVQACLAMENMDLTKDLGKIRAPTLVMNAPGDIITPLDMGPTGIGGRKIHEMIKGSTLKVWEGIGHADLLERPQQSAKLMVSFLKQAGKKAKLSKTRKK